MQCDMKQKRKTINALHHIQRQKDKGVTRLNAEKRKAENERDFKAANEKEGFAWKKTITLLKERRLLQNHVKYLEQERNQLFREVERARTKAEHAEIEKSKIFKLLQVSTIKRNGAQPQGNFPNGDSIRKMVSASQKTTANLLCNLVELWSSTIKLPENDSFHPKNGTTLYEDMLSNFWCSCAKLAKDRAVLFEDWKRQQYSAFLSGALGGNGSSHQAEATSSLIELLWSSVMQLSSKTFIENELNQMSWYQVYASTWGDDQFVSWALSDATSNHEEMEGQSVGMLMSQLAGQYLYARFSQPECFLFPDVGTTVEFSSCQHSQMYLPCYRKKAKEGDLVRVVYPGLYFCNPNEPTGQQVEPVVKPLVVLFMP